MAKNNEKIQLSTVSDILVNFLNELELSINKVFPDTRAKSWFHLDQGALEKCLKDFHSEMKKWKKVFNVDFLTRYQIAALLVHYFLKNFPVITCENQSEADKLSASWLINEKAAIHLAVSSLDNNGSVIKLQTKVTSKLLRFFKNHRESLKVNFEGYLTNSIRFVEHMSLIFYFIEENHRILLLFPS